MGVLRTRIDRVMATAGGDADAIYERARGACADAVRADAEAAERAAATVGDRILTLSRSGTVAAALEAAAPEAVFVAASRPGGEGIGAAETYAEAGFETTLLADTAVADLLADPGAAAETLLVGADAVLADGAVVNKAGTRQAALAAADAGVDRFAVCSRDKIVPGTEFDPEPAPDSVYDGDAALSVRAPTFERTPSGLLSGVITEAGVLSAAEIGSIAESHAELAAWDD
jgi:translation initiation factor 2B subunit (eIF-2B alpha/beta/delta family)